MPWVSKETCSRSSLSRYVISFYARVGLNSFLRLQDVDSAGRGGEYTVQAGFGWTNGVLLWVASNYGDVLVAPVCPDITISAGAGSDEGDGGDGAISFLTNTLALTFVVAIVSVFQL